MDETSLTLGWLIGRRIAGQRSKVKTPIAYLYNGTQLPILPERDAETYPHAVILRGQGTFLGRAYDWAFLYCSDQPIVAESDGNCVVASLPCNYFRSQIDFLSDENNWGEFEYYKAEKTGSTDIFPVLSHELVWSNHDILNSDGSVYLSASDPVPVYA